MATNYDKEIKKAVSPTKPSVNSNYTPGSYAKQNETVASNAQSQINNATNSAQSAYKMATANNEKRASQAESTNATLTRQIGNSMRKGNFSLTNRNVASAASARSSAASASALSAANSSARATRDKVSAQAKVNAMRQSAALQASNTQRDIERSTQRAKTESQQKFQSSEAQKSRDLKNAISKKQKAYDKSQRQLSSYSKTLEARYTSTKAIDKAIKKMKASNDKQKSQKLAYLRALKAKLQAEAKAKASGGRGGRGGYGRRGYGRGGSNTAPDLPDGGEEPKKNSYGVDEGASTKDFNLAKAYNYANGKKVKKGAGANGVERMYAQPFFISGDKKKADASKKARIKNPATSVRWRGTTARKKK